MRLKILWIPNSAGTDLGLKHYLMAVEPPSALHLNGWKVTDAGLKELAGLKDLKELSLLSTQVTDAGLHELAGFKSLQKLNLFRTKASDVGVANLQRALPACEIIH